MRRLRTDDYYTVRAANDLFEMNICGAVTGGKCSDPNVVICNITDAENPTPVLYADNYARVEHDGLKHANIYIHNEEGS